MDNLCLIIPLVVGWLLDKWLGDPIRLPHPIVWFGKMIAIGERRFNRGAHRRRNGALMAVTLILAVFLLAHLLIGLVNWVGGRYWVMTLTAIGVFYCLAGTTLSREVRMVFQALDRSLDEGRRQVSRIVGRDTSSLSAQEVRTAALETLAENLSDGVIAPLFWYVVLGVEGMLAYKMVNTLDSMIGYRNERYAEFGCWAARIDDVANYIPARLTALLMIAVSGKWRLFGFVRRYGKAHASPNSGYPESALAGILNCRFGGPHTYFGEEVWKPYIGHNDRPLTSADMRLAVNINLRAEVLAVFLIVAGRMVVLAIDTNVLLHSAVHCG